MPGSIPVQAPDVPTRRPPTGGARLPLPLACAASRPPASSGSQPGKMRIARDACRRGSSDPIGRALAAGLLLMLAPLPAIAQEKSDIFVNGQRPDSACNGQTSQQPIDLACLNKDLKAAASAAQPTPLAADAITAQATTPSKVGTFSHTATAQRMGQNFGKSAQPWRPPAAQYTSPVRGAAPR